MSRIRHVVPEDAAAWLAMRCALWPDGTADEHTKELAEFFAGKDSGQPMAVLVAEECREHQGDMPVEDPRDDRQCPLVGFAELSIRFYAEGCHSRHVAFLEGWYVVPERRGAGYGRALVEAAEDWGRQQGCSEFASDAENDNQNSIQAHLALGFEDVATIRCFRKDL